MIEKNGTLMTGAPPTLDRWYTLFESPMVAPYGEIGAGVNGTGAGVKPLTDIWNGTAVGAACLAARRAASGRA